MKSKNNRAQFLYNRIAATTFSLLLAGGIAQAVEPDKNILVHDGQKVAFMGDSITAFGWGNPGGYVRLIQDGFLQEGIKIVPIPVGVSGNTSKDMLARLDKDVLSKHPDWMTLSCGVNDVWHGVNGVDLETYKKNITSIVDQATAAGIKVVILTATPIGEQDNPNNQKLVAYNEFLRGLAKEKNLPLADLNAAFQTALKPLHATADSRNFTADGVHMNPEGNVIMSEGCLKAFGISEAKVAQIEQGWLVEPGTAVVSCGYDPRLEVSLGQFRAIEKASAARGISLSQLESSLWFRALGQVIQSHSSDDILNVEVVKKEANAVLLQKIDSLAKDSGSK